MSRIKRSYKNLEIAKNHERVEENSEIFSRAAREGLTKFKKTTKNRYHSKIMKNRKRVEENGEIYSRGAREGPTKFTKKAKNRNHPKITNNRKGSKKISKFI